MESIQIVFIYRTNANCFLGYFISICIFDIFMVPEIVSGRRCKIRCILCLFRPMNAAAAAKCNSGCQLGSVVISNTRMKVIGIRNGDHVFMSRIIRFFCAVLIELFCFFFGIQHVGLICSFFSKNDISHTRITVWQRI